MKPHHSVLLLLGVAVIACDDAESAISPPDGAPDVAVQPPDAAPDATLDAEPPDTEPDDAAVPPDGGTSPDAGQPRHPLYISELMPSNDGAWIDEAGETDDWIELHNRGDEPLSLDGFHIGDSRATRHPLPAIVLEPDGVIVLWADDTPDQGPLHLPFKLSAGGERVFLWGPDGALVDEVRFAAAQPNDAFRRPADGGARMEACRWATPGRPNGDTCGPPPPPAIPDDVVFDPYTWADPWPFPPTPLVMTELALWPPAFVEVLNASDAPVSLAEFELRLAPHAPGRPWPGRADGAPLAWPSAQLQPGQRIAVPVAPADVEAIAADPAFEGVLSLWAAERMHPVERVDFMRWPEGAALTRVPDATGRHRFCASLTRGTPNVTCDPLASRDVGDRVRHLRTPGDFSALARGEVTTGSESVKFVLDLEGGDAVHLLSTEAWDLHYRFVSQVIEGEPALDRCDPAQSAAFLAGWRRFSDENYFEIEGRRYLLGTLVHHGGADLHTVEFAAGDRIVAAQMRRAFFGAMARVMDPTRYSMRPQTGEHLAEMQRLEGQAPIVGPNAPFRDLTYQPLTETVGYGVLTYVPVQALEHTPLGPEVIVVTDQVPNDIDLTGGLITESFQTPLAHVNLLSRNRDTPNMALVDARNHPRLVPLFGRLVRLSVEGGDFDIRPAGAEEAAAFWASRRPQGPPAVPRADTSVRGVVPLEGRGIGDLPSLGAKAAQLAELRRVVSAREACPGPVATPDAPMAIPVVHSLEHFEASGAAALLAELRSDPRFEGDSTVRAAGLARVRQTILRHPVERDLLAELEDYLRTHFGPRRVRFRSSSNTEDLPGFSGAGLYTSVSAEVDSADLDVEDALRTVWSSLWLQRAYDERTYHHISQDGVAMGVLVHPAFLGERANGVAVSRNVLEPIRTEYYLNVQAGEASVANPAPGVSTDQVLYSFRRTPRLQYVGRSNLSPAAPVLTEEEVAHTACTLRAIHDHFRPLIDPDGANRWFAMDIELKLVGSDRQLVVKQARPYSFGSLEAPADCREL